MGLHQNCSHSLINLEFVSRYKHAKVFQGNKLLSKIEWNLLFQQGRIIMLNLEHEHDACLSFEWSSKWCQQGSMGLFITLVSKYRFWFSLIGQFKSSDEISSIDQFKNNLGSWLSCLWIFSLIPIGGYFSWITTLIGQLSPDQFMMV